MSSDSKNNLQYFDLISEELIDHSTSNKKNVSERLSWSNKTESLLSYAGYSMGISSVLRFPYLCYRNGGGELFQKKKTFNNHQKQKLFLGAFLIPYILMIVFCGIPLFFMETSMGQFGSSSCIRVFRMCPLFRGIKIQNYCHFFL